MTIFSLRLNNLGGHQKNTPTPVSNFPLQAMEDALTLQKELLQSLRRLHALADERNDFQV